METNFNVLYSRFCQKIEKHNINIMRFSLAIVYIWFGGLKVVGMSPAGELVEQTVYWFDPKIFVPLLGIFEVTIGLGLIIKRLIPYTIILLLIHMSVTVFPFFILTNTCFDAFPYCPTLVGQYIIKNLVLIAGALVIAGKYNKTNTSKNQLNLNSN